MDQYLLSSCYEAESVLEKSVQQADKCKGPGAGYAEVLPEQAPTAQCGWSRVNKRTTEGTKSDRRSLGTDVGDTFIQHQLCALNRTHGCCCLLGVSSLCLLPREVLSLIAWGSREGWAAFGRKAGLLSPRHMSAPTCIFSVFIKISGPAHDNSAWQMSQFTTSPLNFFTFRRCNFVFFPIMSYTRAL